MSHLCHGKDSESVNSGLRGCRAGEGCRARVEILDRADSFSLDVDNTVLIDHGGGGAGQGCKRDLFLRCAWRRQLGWGLRRRRDARREGVSFTLSVAGTDAKTVITVGQIGNRASQGGGGANECSQGVNYVVANHRLG